MEAFFLDDGAGAAEVGTEQEGLEGLAAPGGELLSVGGGLGFVGERLLRRRRRGWRLVK